MNPLNQNTDINVSILDGQYKDNSPLATVERIKGILRSYGIETMEKWSTTSVPYCHSMSIKIPGTLFSVNGKGLTREFTLASGYGELMERLQLGYVNGANGKKDGDNATEAALWKRFPAQELLERNRNWYTLLSKRAGTLAGIQISPEQIVMQYADPDGTIPVMTFYDLTNDVTAHLPVKLCKMVYTTNGSAAGNSPEETLVQAISEIVERRHQMRVITEKLTLPDIPEEVLKRYTAAYSIIRYVRSQGYRVIIKDCSLGTPFPVVCACFIDKRTGKYHIHFGAYPVFEIALERSLTETFQGRNIENICCFENFIPDNAKEYSVTGILNEMSQGTWEKPAGFFVGKPQYPYNPDAGFDGANNKELLRQCVTFFKNQGFDILVRDSSCLGFCTYQVLIPGYSEMFPHRLSAAQDELRYSGYAAKTLRNPAEAGIQDMLGLLMHMEEYKKCTANLVGVHGFSAIAKIPASLSPLESDLLLSGSLAYVYYTLGQYGQVLKCIEAMLPRCDDQQYLLCLKRYLSMLLSGKKQDEIKGLLELFHRPETVQALYDCLERKHNPLEQFTLHCDMSCGENCPIRSSCFHKHSLTLAELLSRKTAALDFAKFAQELKNLL